MFTIFKKKQQFFTVEEEQRVVQAIKDAERMTSGEVRVFVESRCRFVDPIDRAHEIFYGLKMDKTDDHNGVLVYVAMKDRQMAVYGDEAIHQKVGDQYWNEKIKIMLQHFRENNHADGLVKVITDIGQALHQHFPYNNDTDKNELPDDIVFGR
jgi:uncharacterized membrane protein